MYRDMRYVLDRRHPLHPLAQVRVLFLGFRLSYVIPKPVVEAVGMYGPPSDCKPNLCGECFGSAQMYPACLWSFRSWP